MTTRRDVLLGIVAGAAGFGLLANRATAWYYEDMSPDTAAAFDAACKPAGNNHTGLIASARQDLLQRIAQGLLPAGATEQVGCPICGCSFMVTADATN